MHRFYWHMKNGIEWDRFICLKLSNHISAIWGESPKRINCYDYIAKWKGHE